MIIPPYTSFIISKLIVTIQDLDKNKSIDNLVYNYLLVYVKNHKKFVK